MIRILDRLIAGTFLRIFALFILGAPLLFVVGNIVENIDRYFDRGLTAKEVAWAYVYQLPSSSPGRSRSRLSPRPSSRSTR